MVALSQTAGPENLQPHQTRRHGDTGKWGQRKEDVGAPGSRISKPLALQLAQNEQLPPPFTPGTIHLLSPTWMDRLVQVLEMMENPITEDGGQGDQGTDIPLPSQRRDPPSLGSEELSLFHKRPIESWSVPTCGFFALLSLSEAARGAQNVATLDSGNLLNG